MPSTPSAAKSADEIIAYVLGHPIRVDVLRIFNEREASAAEVARELREDAKKVGNHVKVLLDHGCIEWTRTQPNRGAEEHFYRSSRGRMGVSAEEWVRLRPKGRLEISTHDFLAAAAEGLAAIRAGTFDTRLDRHLSYQKAEVDEQAWSDLTSLFEETARRSAEIMDAAERRLSRAGAGVPIVTALLSAERAPTSSSESAVSRLALPLSER